MSDTTTRRPVTLETVKAMRPGDALYIPRDGRNPERWRVNGAVKVWARDPSRVRVPLKFGLYNYSSITEAEISSGRPEREGWYIDRA